MICKKNYKYLVMSAAMRLNNFMKGDKTMLKITKVVSQSTTNMSGCGKYNDHTCGIRAKAG